MSSKIIFPQHFLWGSATSSYQIEGAHDAIECGAPLHGYFAWSLMDNFEWSFGFTKRFGIVYVDYETQQRIVKESGKWYSNVITQNGFES